MEALFFKKNVVILLIIPLFLLSTKGSLGQNYECVSFFLLNNDEESYRSQKFLYYPLTLIIDNRCNEAFELRDFNKILSSKQNRGSDDMYWELITLNDTVPEYTIITSVKKKREIFGNLSIPPHTVLSTLIYLDLRNVIYLEGYYKIVLFSSKTNEKLAESIISLQRKNH